MKTKNRFKEFTDDELYMLKRQAIESSFEIVMMDKYEEELVKIHGELLNEIILEIKLRKDI